MTAIGRLARCGVLAALVLGALGGIAAAAPGITPTPLPGDPVGLGYLPPSAAATLSGNGRP